MFYLDISPSIQKPHVPAITEWLVYMTLFFVQGREASCANNHWMTCVHDCVFCPGLRGLLCQQSLNDLCTWLCFLSRVARLLMPAITEWLVYTTVFFVQGCEASYASNHWMTCVHDSVFCPGSRGLLCQQSLNDLCTRLCFLSRVASCWWGCLRCSSWSSRRSRVYSCHRSLPNGWWNMLALTNTCKYNSVDSPLTQWQMLAFKSTWLLYNYIC